MATFINVLTVVGTLIYGGLVYFGNLLANLGDLIVPWGMAAIDFITTVVAPAIMAAIKLAIYAFMWLMAALVSAIMIIGIAAVAAMYGAAAWINNDTVGYKITSVKMIKENGSFGIGFKIITIYNPLLDLELPFCAMYMEVNDSEIMDLQFGIIESEVSTPNIGLQDVDSQSNPWRDLTEEIIHHGNAFLNALASILAIVGGSLGALAVLCYGANSGPWGMAGAYGGMAILIFSFGLLLAGLAKMYAFILGVPKPSPWWFLGALLGIIIAFLTILIVVPGGPATSGNVFIAISLSIGITSIVLSIFEMLPFTPLLFAFIINSVQLALGIAGLLIAATGVHYASKTTSVLVAAVILFIMEVLLIGAAIMFAGWFIFELLF